MVVIDICVQRQTVKQRQVKAKCGGETSARKLATDSEQQYSNGRDTPAATFSSAARCFEIDNSYSARTRWRVFQLRGSVQQQS